MQQDEAPKITSITCMTSISAIVMERYLNKQGNKKRCFTTKCTVAAAIFKDSISGMIPVAVVKINKMEDSRHPRLGGNKVVFFAGFLQQYLHYKVYNYPLTKNKTISNV